MNMGGEQADDESSWMTNEQMSIALERHHLECFGWALSCCGRDQHMAEDVLQSSYLKVLDGAAVFGGRSSLRTWLFGVIWRTAREHDRRRGWNRLLGLQHLLYTAAEKDSAPGPVEAFQNSESSHQLLQALGKLSPCQKDVLHLVFYQDLAIREAAEVLGISVGSARTHYERGKARLRQLLPSEDLT